MTLSSSITVSLDAPPVVSGKDVQTGSSTLSAAPAQRDLGHHLGGPRIALLLVEDESDQTPWVAPCHAAVMDIISLSDAPGYDIIRPVAEPLLEGTQSNVRIIPLSHGQAMPPQGHGSSDLVLYAVEGEGVLDTGGGKVGFAAGSLAFYRGDEELRVSNEGRTGLTLLAFLAPPFPPRSEA
jgi:quercetin dioxygenase-like cupin family protein